MERLKIDQLIALTQNLNAIADAIRVTADKLIELGVIGNLNTMAKTVKSCEVAIDNLEEVKQLVDDALINNNSKYTPKF